MVIISTNVFLAPKIHTRTNTLTLMTPPGCYSGAHVLDVSESIIPSKLLEVNPRSDLTVLAADSP